jgi:uridine kinase
MSVRDGCNSDPGVPANRRYVEGQKLYLAACSPASAASVVIDNSDIQQPNILRNGLPAAPQE